MSSLRYSKERVGALTDGVVAIAATLLVLDLKLPDAPAALTPDVLAHSLHLFVGWVISIAMIGAMWHEHHHLFHRTAALDGTLIALTFVQLALISLIPFGSGLVAEYPASLTAALIFSGIMLANGLALAGNARLLAARPDLARPGPDREGLRERAGRQALCYLGLALLAVAGAVLHHPLLGVVMWGLSPFLLAALGRDAAPAVPSATGEGA